jgi:putative membrane protein
MRNEKVILEATFDEKLVRYWMLSTQLVLFISIVGIPLMPVWLIFGWSFHRKQFERLTAKLTDKSLEIRRGYLFRMEKNVPLDRIQDLTMTEGPLLRWLGIARLHVETAGQNVGGGGGAHLVGVVDAPAFRDAVLDQRDAIAGSTGDGVTSTRRDSGVGGSESASLAELLESVRRIEKSVERIADRSS